MNSNDNDIKHLRDNQAEILSQELDCNKTRSTILKQNGYIEQENNAIIGINRHKPELQGLSEKMRSFDAQKRDR